MTNCGHCGDAHDERLEACPRTGLRRAAQGPCGAEVDRYLVESLVGSGGFGSVYRARHVHTDQLVALKILRSDLASDPQMLERLFQEARAAALIDDPRIVKVSDCGLAATGEAFIAMELLEGRDLRDVLDHGPHLTHMQSVEILLEVLGALEAAHSNGVVHRDLKPANVFLAQQRIKQQVKLLDFGISKMRADDSKAGLTRTNTAMGTPSYMAPEQMQNARGVDGRADIYSVAAMGYELLCGARPFEGEGYEDVVVKVFTQTAMPLAQRDANLPASLCLAIDRGLAKDPAARWQSAREFADALGLTAEMPAPPQRKRRPTASPLPATVPQLATPAATPSPQLPQRVVSADPPASASNTRLALGVTLGALAALGGAALGIWATRSTVPQVAPQLVAPPRAALPQPLVDTSPVAEPLPESEPAPRAPPPRAPPRAPRAPRPTAGPVQIHEPTIVGQLDYEAVRRLLDSSLSQLEACRTGRAVTVHVHLHTHGEGVGLARDDPNKKNEDLEAARCVANRLQAVASRGWQSGGSGIIAVSVTLAAR